MKRALWSVLLACAFFALSGCTAISPGARGNPASKPLNVLAAASLKEAFERIGAEFEAAHPGTDVVFSFAGSQQLAQQIAEGAPADAFASADARQMQNAVDSGRIDEDAPQVFARNRLVVVVPADNPADIKTLLDLAKPGIKLVLADESVPVGRYSRRFLANASALPGYTEAYSATVLSNVVSFDENVRSVLNRVVLGEADAGIVYQTDVGAAARDAVQVLEVPDYLNVIATYPIAALNDSSQAARAQTFVDYVLSEAGQRALREFGFMPAAQ